MWLLHHAHQGFQFNRNTNNSGPDPGTETCQTTEVSFVNWKFLSNQYTINRSGNSPSFFFFSFFFFFCFFTDGQKVVRYYEYAVHNNIQRKKLQK